jgi:hypothetical protein
MSRRKIKIITLSDSPPLDYIVALVKSVIDIEVEVHDKSKAKEIWEKYPNTAFPFIVLEDGSIVDSYIISSLFTRRLKTLEPIKIITYVLYCLFFIEEVHKNLF